MVENLDHLLPADHFLDIAVQTAQMFLLPGEIPAAAAAGIADIQEHGPIADRDDQGQLPVEDVQQHQQAHHLDKGLNDHGEAVVQGVGNRVHVVGKITHGVAVAAAVKERQRQGLQMGKQVPADIIEDFLGGPDHGLGVAQGRQNAGAVDGRGDDHAPDQRCAVAAGQTVDNGPDHIGAQQIGQGADGGQNAHNDHEDRMAAHVTGQGTDGAAQVFRPLIGGSGHGRRLLSPGNGKSPGRWGPWPGGCRGCRRREPCRRPESQ